MTNLEILLSVITAMSALGNLGQWVNIKALKDKARYETDDVHIESLKKTIDALQDENSRLTDRIKQLEDRSLERERQFEERIEQLELKLKNYANA